MSALTDTCRIEGRCIKCRRLVVQRPLLGVASERDDYVCGPCGGPDVRLQGGNVISKFFRQMTTPTAFSFSSRGLSGTNPRLEYPPGIESDSRGPKL